MRLSFPISTAPAACSFATAPLQSAALQFGSVLDDPQGVAFDRMRSSPLSAWIHQLGVVSLKNLIELTFQRAWTPQHGEVGVERMEVKSHTVARIVEHLARHEYEQVRQEFNAELAAAIAADKLALAWMDLEIKPGKLTGPGEVRHEQASGVDIFFVRLDFELGAVDLKIAIGPSGKVIGFFVQPAGLPVLGVQPCTRYGSRSGAEVPLES